VLLVEVVVVELLEVVVEKDESAVGVEGSSTGVGSSGLFPSKVVSVELSSRHLETKENETRTQSR